MNYSEIPNCSICLSELVTDLTCTPCGHVFHANWQALFSIRDSLVVSKKSCPLCRINLTPSKLIPMNFTFALTSQAIAADDLHEADFATVKEQWMQQKTRVTELEAAQAVHEIHFKQLEADKERLKQEIRLKEHSHQQIELMQQYRESERDELNRTITRLQAIVASASSKLQSIEHENQDLQIMSQVKDFDKLTEGPMGWANQMRAKLNKSEQALHFYNALKSNSRLLKETEVRLAEANSHVEALKIQNSKLKSTEVQKAMQARPFEEPSSLKRPRADDFCISEGGEALDPPAKRRPVSLIK